MIITKRLFSKDFTNFTFPAGLLLEVVPSDTSLNSISEMTSILKMLGQYPSRFSFEIWKDKRFSFHFFSLSKSAEGLIRGQLSSVYPQCEIKKSSSFMPSINPGDYVSSCTFKQIGQYFSLNNPDDYHSDPLRHLLSAMNIHNSKFIIQFLFEIKKKIPKEAVITLYQKNLSLFVFQCLIRIIAINKNREKAKESCIHLARIFSVFGSESSRLIPKFPYFYNPLKSVAKRKFPIFQKAILLSIPELASFVHLPVGARDLGVEYSKPSLSW